MKFVLIHGAFGSPEGNWFPELKDKLESLGQTVIVPQFPVESWDELTKAGPGIVAKKQTLANWLAVLEPIVKSFHKGEKLCFIGHSLGPVFILHAVEHFHLQLDSAIFVSPFMDPVKSKKFWQFDIVNSSFYKTDFDFEELKKSIPVSYVLYSDTDPYVSKNHSQLFGNALNSSMILVKRAGHMNSEVNLNEFPLVLDLCLTRLDLTLFQRYLALRQKVGAIDYMHATKGGVIKLKAQEALSEGVFRFSHLEKSGFCTAFTGLSSFWNPNLQYMKDARRAARRIGDFTRVIVLEKLSDIKNPLWKQQIELDLAAGIHIYLCLYDDIKEKIIEPDFGIWDESYVCIVPYDRKNHTVRGDTVELNSLEGVIALANEWKKFIMDHATQIHNSTSDVDGFYNTHNK